MAMQKCKECKKEISSSAKSCPHCGASAPKKPGGCAALIAIIAVIWVVSTFMGNDTTTSTRSTPTSTTSQTEAGDHNALKTRLAYLTDIPEVSAVGYIDNQVYIGFNKQPLDIAAIIGGAAAFGSEAYGSRVTVWGCVYDKNQPNPKEWLVYKRGNCYAIGRGGKTRTNRC